MSKYLKLILAVIICEGAGLIGSVFVVNSVSTWYPLLNKPFFNPPSWIFAPVWTILYFMMGISLYLAWRKKNTDLKWFWTQLFLNSLWSIIFFGLKSPLLAFIIIVLLWVSIFFTIKTFIKINKAASYLLLPYIIWVSFAMLLNLSIVILNR